MAIKFTNDVPTTVQDFPKNEIKKNPKKKAGCFTYFFILMIITIVYRYSENSVDNNKSAKSTIEKLNSDDTKSDRILEFSFPHKLTRENLSSQMYMDSYSDGKFSVLYLNGVDNEEITFDQKSKLLIDKINQMYNLSPHSIKVATDEKVGNKNITIMTALVGDTDFAVYYFVTESNLTNILLYTFNTLDDTAKNKADDLETSIKY